MRVRERERKSISKTHCTYVKQYDNASMSGNISTLCSYITLCVCMHFSCSFISFIFSFVFLLLLLSSFIFVHTDSWEIIFLRFVLLVVFRCVVVHFMPLIRCTACINDYSLRSLVELSANILLWPDTHHNNKNWFITTEYSIWFSIHIAYLIFHHHFDFFGVRCVWIWCGHGCWFDVAYMFVFTQIRHIVTHQFSTNIELLYCSQSGRTKLCFQWEISEFLSIFNFLFEIHLILYGITIRIYLDKYFAWEKKIARKQWLKRLLVCFSIVRLYVIHTIRCWCVRSTKISDALRPMFLWPLRIFSPDAITWWICVYAAIVCVLVWIHTLCVDFMDIRIPITVYG